MGRDKSKKDRDKKSKKKRKHSDALERQLKHDREAVETLSMLLLQHPAVRQELRQMLWTIDQGEAVDVSGIPDEEIKDAVKKLLKRLGLSKGSKGLYSLPKGSPATLGVVGFVFDASPGQFAPPVPAAAGPSSGGDGDGGATGSVKPSGSPSASPSSSGSGTSSGGDAGTRVATTAERPMAAVPASPRARHDAAPGDDGPRGQPAQPPDAQDGSRQGPSPAGGASPGARADEALPQASQPAAAVAPRRVLGPAAPSAAMLAAAAAHGTADAAADAEARAADEDDDDDDAAGLLVGPPPPELVLEMDAAPTDAREAEVVRVLRVLRDAAAEAGGGATGGAAPAHALLAAASAPRADGSAAPVDAYAVLGVPRDAPVGDVKKRYMRLSLLIHPDKCGHADAHTAFQAVAKAAKVLQDDAQRKALDEHLDDVELRKLAVAEAAKEERERAWRVAMGQEDAGAAAAAAAAARPQAREAWMTELPAERKPKTKMDQVSVRAFSQSGVRSRGDTSSWTDNPLQREQRAAGLLGPGDGGVLAIGMGGGGAGASGGVGGGGGFSLDAYNSTMRKKTMLEEHQERMAKGLAPGGKPPSAKETTRTAAAGAALDTSSGSSGGSSDGGDSSSDSDGAPHHAQDRRRGDKDKRSRDADKSKKRKKDTKEKKSKKRKKKSKDRARDKKRVARVDGQAPDSKPKEAWEGVHPWKPWDREKDLELKPRMQNPATLIRNAAAMNASRFQSAGGTRHFL